MFGLFFNSARKREQRIAAVSVHMTQNWSIKHQCQQMIQKRCFIYQFCAIITKNWLNINFVCIYIINCLWVLECWPGNLLSFRLFNIWAETNVLNWKSISGASILSNIWCVLDLVVIVRHQPKSLSIQNITRKIIGTIIFLVILLITPSKDQKTRYWCLERKPVLAMTLISAYYLGKHHYF